MGGGGGTLDNTSANRNVKIAAGSADGGSGVPVLLLGEAERMSVITGVDGKGKTVIFHQNIEALKGWGSDNKQTVGELLLRFFAFFGSEVMWASECVSVREGRIIPVPACMAPVADDGAAAGGGRRGHAMYIEDCLDDSNNVARCVDHKGRLLIQEELQRAWAMLRGKGDLEAAFARRNQTSDDREGGAPEGDPESTCERRNQTASSSSPASLPVAPPVLPGTQDTLGTGSNGSDVGQHLSAASLLSPSVSSSASLSSCVNSSTSFATSSSLSCNTTVACSPPASHAPPRPMKDESGVATAGENGRETSGLVEVAGDKAHEGGGGASGDGTEGDGDTARAGSGRRSGVRQRGGKRRQEGVNKGGADGGGEEVELES